MKSYLIKSLIALTSLLLITGMVIGASSPAMAQGNLRTFWGPKEFLRLYGGPIVEEVHINITDYEPPFILHLRNGDENGDHRVSSAWIWLNDQLVLSPSNFNQQVSGHDFEVSLSEDPSNIKVKVAGKPGGKLTIWIEGFSRNTRTVGPEGGTLTFPNGIILDIPSGAVNEPVNIEITDLSCEEVDAIILSQQLATQKKRCLRGFSAEPDGLEFNKPIMAIIPVILEPGEIPVRIGVDFNKHVEWTMNGALVYRGGEGVIEMGVEHFSPVVTAALENKRVQSCKRCDTYDPNRCGPLDAPNPVFGGLQPGACQLLNTKPIPPETKTEREKCAPPDLNLKCCMEEAIHVKVTEADFSAGECQILGGKLSVTYPACEGQLTITDSMGGSAGCPEGATFKMEITSDRPWIHACEKANLKATITATDQNGKVLFENAPFPADWTIEFGKEVAQLGAENPPNGIEVQGGGKSGDVQIRASALGAEDKYFARYTLTVIPNGTLSVNPSQETIRVGDSRTLKAEIKGAEGNLLDASTVSWSSSDSNIADVAPKTGASTSVGGADCGQSTITAKYHYRCETMEAAARITVEPRVDSLQINPLLNTLSVGQAIALEAIPRDMQGNVVDVGSINPDFVTWSSSLPDIASASPGIGWLTFARAHNVGEAEISAVYSDNAKQCGTRSASAIVKVDCDPCTFLVSPPAKELVLGSGGTILTAQLRDVNGDLIRIRPPSITVTWEKNKDFVSLRPINEFQAEVIPIIEGVVTIIATYKDMFGSEKKATAMITVIPPPKSWHNWSQVGKFENIKLGADGQGNVYAAWQERMLPEVYNEGNEWPHTIYENIRIGRVGLGQIIPITTCEGSSGYGTSLIDLFVDKIGNMIVVYETRTLDTRWKYYTWAKRYNVNGGWDNTSVLIAETYYINRNSLAPPSIAADSSGNAIISDNDSGTIRALRYDVNQGWQPMIQLAQSSNSYSAKIAMDPSGNAIVIWSNFNNQEPSFEIHTKKYRAESGWDDQSRRRIASPTQLDLKSLNILVDPQGNAIVTWYNPEVGIRARHYDAITGWHQTVTNIANNTATTPQDSQLKSQYYASMDETGNAMVVYWEGPYGQESLMSRRYNFDQGWENQALTVMTTEAAQARPQSMMAFSMHGGGYATLINGYYNTIRHGDINNFWDESEFSFFARQYRPGEGWYAPALNTLNLTFYPCKDPLGHPVLGCWNDQFQWLDEGAMIINRYGDATGVMVRINGAWEGHWVTDTYGNPYWVFDRWVYDQSAAMVIEFE